MNYLERARDVLDIEADAIRKVRDTLGESFSRTVNLMIEALDKGGKIVITGIGKNIPIGRKIAATLSSTGAPAIVLHPIEALHGDIGLVASRDLVVAMSYSGETEELLTLLPSLKRLKVRIVALTGVPGSSLGRHSDEIIDVSIDREACPFNMAPTASTTTALALGDALAIVLLEARGFRREDYAHLHPGGAIGRTLLLRAADIMRTGQRVALLDQHATIKEAVLAMTRARAGSVAVLDNQQRLLGIFTDGDLRRLAAQAIDMERACVTEHMTRNPVTVTASHLAVEVLAIYETHNIDDLVVLDEQRRVVGLIDIQDLPKLKIL